MRFELTDQTRQAIDEYLRITDRKAGQFLFAGRRDDGSRGLTTRRYARLVQEWVASIGLGPAKYGLDISLLTFGCGAVGGLMTKGDAADQMRAVRRALEIGVRKRWPGTPSFSGGWLAPRSKPNRC